MVMIRLIIRASYGDDKSDGEGGDYGEYMVDCEGSVECVSFSFILMFIQIACQLTHSPTYSLTH